MKIRIMDLRFRSTHDLSDRYDPGEMGISFAIFHLIISVKCSG